MARSRSSSSSAAACLLVVLMLAVAAQRAAGHMVMIEPKSRNWFDYLLRYNYNPHAVHGGGACWAGWGGWLWGLAARLQVLCRSLASPCVFVLVHVAHAAV
jgi:hypothetical protein